MNDLLGQLMGGGQQQEFEDFSRRYDQGSPWDGFDDDEARDKYRRVAPNLPPDLYRESAEETFSRMTPEQRFELGRKLQQSARQEGLRFDGDDDALRDPRRLASAAAQIQQDRPDFLEQLLGGGSSAGAGGGMGGAGGMGGMLSGGLGRAALGGIAAIAVKKMMGGR